MGYIEDSEKEWESKIYIKDRLGKEFVDNIIKHKKSMVFVFSLERKLNSLGVYFKKDKKLRGKDVKSK